MRNPILGKVVGNDNAVEKKDYTRPLLLYTTLNYANGGGYILEVN